MIAIIGGFLMFLLCLNPIYFAGLLQLQQHGSLVFIAGLFLVLYWVNRDCQDSGY